MSFPIAFKQCRPKSQRQDITCQKQERRYESVLTKNPSNMPVYANRLMYVYVDVHLSYLLISEFVLIMDKTSVCLSEKSLAPKIAEF